MKTEKEHEVSKIEVGSVIAINPSNLHLHSMYMANVRLTDPPESKIHYDYSITDVYQDCTLEAKVVKYILHPHKYYIMVLDFVGDNPDKLYIGLAFKNFEDLDKLFTTKSYFNLH